MPLFPIIHWFHLGHWPILLVTVVILNSDWLSTRCELHHLGEVVLSDWSDGTKCVLHLWFHFNHYSLGGSACSIVMWWVMVGVWWWNELYRWWWWSDLIMDAMIFECVIMWYGVDTCDIIIGYTDVCPRYYEVKCWVGYPSFILQGQEVVCPITPRADPSGCLQHQVGR